VVVEEQIQEELLLADQQRLLATVERKAATQLEQEPLDVVRLQDPIDISRLEGIEQHLMMAPAN
jgi:hypothetical protein